MKLLNAFGFNLIWFGCIFYGNYFVPVAIAILAIHLYFVKSTQHEIKTLLIATNIGVFIDVILTYMNIYQFDTLSTLSFLGLPLWLITLWLCFAATINHSIQFVKCSLPIQILVGAIAFPLSYSSGHKLGAVGLGYPLFNTIIVLSIIWVLGTLLIFYCLKTFNRIQTMQENPYE